MEMLTPNISGFGHDKSLTLRPYAQLPADKRPTLFYAGDGVSDLSAARETDLLFAKKGHGKSIDFHPHVHHHHSCPPRRFHFSKRERTKEKNNSLTNPHQQTSSLTARAKTCPSPSSRTGAPSSPPSRRSSRASRACRKPLTKASRTLRPAKPVCKYVKVVQACVLPESAGGPQDEYMIDVFEKGNLHG